MSNPLIQPHFDYECISWYPENKKKMKFTQNKCIRFCLKLNSRHQIGAKESKEIKVFKYWKRTSPFHVNEVFVPSRNAYKTKSHVALEIPLRRSNLGQKSI